MKKKDRDKNPCAACEFERSSLCHHRVNKPPRPSPSQLRALPFNRYEHHSPPPSALLNVHASCKGAPNPTKQFSVYVVVFFNTSAPFTRFSHTLSLSLARAHTHMRTQDVKCALFPIKSCKNASLDRVHTARKVRLSPLLSSAATEAPALQPR